MQGQGGGENANAAGGNSTAPDKSAAVEDDTKTKAKGVNQGRKHHRHNWPGEGFFHGIFGH